jgi:hypothetical protein
VATTALGTVVTLEYVRARTAEVLPG